MQDILTLSNVEPSSTLDTPINPMECVQIQFISFSLIDVPAFILKTGIQIVFLRFSRVQSCYEIFSVDKVEPKTRVLCKFEKFIRLPENTYNFSKRNLFAIAEKLDNNGETTDFSYVYLKTSSGEFYYLSSEKAGKQCLFPRGVPKLSPVELVLKSV